MPIILPPYYNKPPTGSRPDFGHPLMQGLVGWWPFLEGGGNTVYDYSKNGNHGTMAQADQAGKWEAGNTRFGGTALDFDGSNDYVLKDSPVLDSYPLTMSCWFRTGLTGVLNGAVVMEVLYSGYIGIIIDSGRCRAEVRNSVTGSSASPVFGDGVWNHCVAVFPSAASRTVYLNGVQASEDNTDTTSFPAVTRTIIGQLWGIYKYQGQLDDVRIYNRALTQHEITQLYLNPWGVFKTKRLWVDTVSGGTETASVSPVVIDLTIPSVTATYVEVQTATISPVVVELTPTTTTATYVQVETATVSPVVINLTPPDVTATYIQIETATVAPVVIDLAIPSVTASGGGTETATVEPVVINLTTPSVTATYQAVINSAVSPVAVDLTIPAVIANYTQVETAGISPVNITLSVVEISANYTQVETAGISPVSVTLSVVEISASYSEVSNAGVTPIGITLTVVSVTASYQAVVSAGVSPVALTLSIPDVTATADGTAAVEPVSITLSIPSVTATYIEIDNAVVSPVVLTLITPDVTATSDVEEEVIIEEVKTDIPIPVAHYRIGAIELTMAGKIELNRNYGTIAVDNSGRVLPRRKQGMNLPNGYS